MKPQAIFDSECYPNYYLLAFKRLTDGQVLILERTETQELDADILRQVVRKYELISFNGIKYDVPLLRLALSGADNRSLKRLSDQLITNLTPYQAEQQYKLPSLLLDHVDLIELAPGKGSLKNYAANLHAKTIRDLPFDPNVSLTPDQIVEVRDYCSNDLDLTHLLLDNLRERLELRRQMSREYHVDLRSKGDAQVAEAVIIRELTQRLGYKPVPRNDNPGDFRYIAPDWLIPTSEPHRRALEIATTTDFILDKNGRIQLPAALDGFELKLGRSIYRLGIGGLHSSEETITHRSDDRTLLVDWDVASYYPSIILGCRLYPEHLGEAFLDVYRGIVERRLAAKAAGDKVTDAALKITINGSFGKLGSPYSALYAPQLMLQVTLTGQLALLMLIGSLEERGVPVVSANTDGLVCRCAKDREQVMLETIKRWEARTGFIMERADYRMLCSRDVNNYLALKPDGKAKLKGCFAPAGWQKTPTAEVCVDAVLGYLKDGISLRETIEKCVDITRFVSVRKVTGGAVFDNKRVKIPNHSSKEDLISQAGYSKVCDGWWCDPGNIKIGSVNTDKAYSLAKSKLQKIEPDLYLGKIVRWYNSKNSNNHIKYSKTGNLVPKTKGVVPLMTLPETLPIDLDYDWYIREAEELLYDVGYKARGQLGLF